MSTVMRMEVAYTAAVIRRTRFLHFAMIALSTDSPSVNARAADMRLEFCQTNV
jgi:hypothetical protein